MSKKNSLQYKLYYSKQSPNKLETRDISGEFINFNEHEISWRTAIEYLQTAKYVSINRDGFHNLLPKGCFIKTVVETLGEEIMDAVGALPYKFASIFPYVKNDAKTNLVEKFKDYLIEVPSFSSDAKFYLKYASDPMLFDYFKDRTIAVPKTVYSPDYFFRNIKKGEIKPIINPHEFQITDYHMFTHNNDFDAFTKLAILNKKAMLQLMGDKNWYLSLDTNEVFFDENKEKIVSMLKDLDENAVINVTDQRTHYYSLQNQYIVYFTSKDKTQFANLQFDEINGKTFNIREENTGDFVTVIHGSMFGRLEKVFTIIFGRAFSEARENNSKPVLPIWLSPVVCRIIPVANSVNESPFLDNLKKELYREKVRFDLDNRNVSISAKAKGAEQDWIPYTIFIGEKELHDNVITIRNRYNMSDKTLELKAFLETIRGQIMGYPNLKQTTPNIFVGNENY